MAEATINSIADKTSDMPDKGSKGPKGPPPASPKPRSASDGSLFATAGQSAVQDGKAGLGAEGGDSNIMGTQGLALVQRGMQMLNLAFPDNPGLVAVLADLMGRLQTIIPQLVAGSANGSMGLFGGGPMGQQPMGQPPGMGGGMAPPGMPGQGMPPMGGAPMGGAMPPQGQPPMPPR